MVNAPLEDESADPSGTWSNFWHDIQRRGIQRCSVFIVPPFHSASVDRVRQFWWGYQPDWVAYYRAARANYRDELPDYVIDHGRPMLLADAVKLVPATKVNRATKGEFLRYYDNDGVAAPLYGPCGHKGLLLFSFGIRLESADVPRADEIIRIGRQAFFEFAVCQQNEIVAAMPLSPRELEIVELSAKGQTNKELARTLGISPNSVDTYMRRVFAKLGVTDRAQAVLRCMSLGLVRL